MSRILGNYNERLLGDRLDLFGISFYINEKSRGKEIIIPLNKIKDSEEKKKIYEILAEYYNNINGGRFTKYNNINGGRFTEFLSKFYRGEIK